MAIKINVLKCPRCGADLPIEEGREKRFCSYCGTPIIITNENEHIHRHIDEAQLKEAETEQMVRMRQIDMEEKSIAAGKKLIVIWVAATVVLIIIGIIGMTIENTGMGLCFLLGISVGLFGLSDFSKKKKNTRKYVGSNEVIITEVLEDFFDKNFNSVEMLYKTAGFSNVTTVPLNDLKISKTKKNGKVDEVTINGSSDFCEGDVFHKSAVVLIMYHSTR